MLNSASFMGRLTADPTVKSTDANTTVVSFTLAIQRDFTNHDGERETDFIPVSVWNLRKKFIEKYLKKGALIGAKGRIQTGKWNDNEGKIHYRFELVAENIYPTDFQVISEKLS